jgi:hypothetical protein
MNSKTINVIILIILITTTTCSVNNNNIILQRDTTTKVILSPSSTTTATTIQSILQIDFTNQQPTTATPNLFLQVEPCSAQKHITMLLDIDKEPTLSSYTSSISISSLPFISTVKYSKPMTVYIGFYNNDTTNAASLTVTPRLSIGTPFVDDSSSKFQVQLTDLNSDMASSIQVRVRWHLPNTFTAPSNLEYKIVYALPNFKDEDTKNNCIMKSICGAESCGVPMTTNYQQFNLNTTTGMYDELFTIQATAAVENSKDLLFNIIARDVTQQNLAGIYTVYDSKQNFLGSM